MREKEYNTINVLHYETEEVAKIGMISQVGMVTYDAVMSLEVHHQFCKHGDHQCRQREVGEDKYTWA